jgi:TatD DNase family protein
MRLIDAHAHLEELHNLEMEFEKARLGGVIGIIAVGSDLASNKRVLEISLSQPGFVFAALGLHPWSLREGFSQEVEFIEQNINKCVALGEVGIDYWIKKDRRLQLAAFTEILNLAERHQKPLILHTRGAWRDVFELIGERRIEKAVFHWYSGPTDTLRKLLNRGYYVSATPAAEYSEPHRQALKEVPLERLLLETDAPVVYKGLESRPSDVVKTLRAVSKLKGVAEKKVAEITTENAIKLFGLSPG